MRARHVLSLPAAVAVVAVVAACTGSAPDGFDISGSSGQPPLGGATTDAAASAGGDDSGVSTCKPATCASLGADCGGTGDACGGILHCGTCVAGETCGAAGPNKCGTGTCHASTCQSLGANCGPAGDGCGNILQCGTCTAPQTCGGGGHPNQCGGGGSSDAGNSDAASNDSGSADSGSSCKTPTSCSTLIKQGLCGPGLPDGCGGSQYCGCPQGLACYQGPGCQAACTSCQQQGSACGPTPDGCGGTLDCGSCPQGEQCALGVCGKVCPGPPPGGSTIGGPCNSDKDCSQSQVQGLTYDGWCPNGQPGTPEKVICLVPFASNFPNGMCTVEDPCLDDLCVGNQNSQWAHNITCPSGTTCLQAVEDANTHTVICEQNCKTNADCRDSCYECGSGTCVPTGACLQANSQGVTPVCK